MPSAYRGLASCVHHAKSRIERTHHTKMFQLRSKRSFYTKNAKVTESVTVARNEGRVMIQYLRYEQRNSVCILLLSL